MGFLTRRFWVLFILCCLVSAAIVGLQFVLPFSSAPNTAGDPTDDLPHSQHPNLQPQQPQPNPTTPTKKSPLAYDEEYFEYQRKYGEFGGRVKADFMNVFTTAGGDEDRTILGFGTGGGFVLNGILGKDTNKIGVEINPTARAYANEHFPFRTVSQLEMVDRKVDFLYSSSVLEHVDCPICEVRKMKKILKDDGILLISIVNDGAMERQDNWKPNDPNHHIYTWNGLLLGNMIEGAGFHVCDCISFWTAWASVDINDYKRDPCDWCRRSMKEGKKIQGKVVSCVAGKSDAICPDAIRNIRRLQDCQYVCA